MNRYINKIAAGDVHTVWIKPDGTVGACGGNKKKQCDVSEWRNIISVACGKTHTVGLRSDGTVVACGSNFWGECDVSGWRNIDAIVCGWSATVGIEKNGTVHLTGYFLTSSDAAFLKNSTHISLGDGFAVAVKLGKASACGSSISNRTSGIEKWTDIVYVASGLDHTLGVRNDGRVFGVGYNIYYELSVSNWSNVTKVACGRRHSIGLTGMRTLLACGSNKEGQLNVGTWSDIIEVACGSFHTVGRRADGSLVATGLNKDGQCNLAGARSVSNSDPSQSPIFKKPTPTPAPTPASPTDKTVQDDVADQLRRLQEERERLEAERLRIAEETERLQTLERERLERERIEAEERERAERERLEAEAQEQKRREELLAAREQERVEILSARQAPPEVAEELISRRQSREASVEQLCHQRNAAVVSSGAVSFVIEAESTKEQLELADAEGRNYAIIGKQADFKETLKNRARVNSRHIALLVKDGRLYAQNLSTINETSVSGITVKADEVFELFDGDRFLLGKNDATGAAFGVIRVEDEAVDPFEDIVDDDVDDNINDEEVDPFEDIVDDDIDDNINDEEVDPFEDIVDDEIEEVPVSEEQAELDLLRSFAGVSVAKKTPKKETLPDFQYIENESGEIVLTKYTGDDSTVRIPASVNGKSVVAIGAGCFYMNRTLRAVDMVGTDVKRIESDAFFCCRSLETVITVADRYHVGASAFEGCENLVFIGSSKRRSEFGSRGAHLSLRHLGDKAFKGCKSLPLVKIKFDDNFSLVTGLVDVELAAEAFSGCVRLETALISAGVATKNFHIAPAVFSGCRSLKKLALPSRTRAEFVSEDFLDGCRSLVSIELGAKSDAMKVFRRMGLGKIVTKVKE